MSTYEKVYERLRCKICNCWIADNQPSIRAHEQGARHQINKRIAMQDADKKRREESIQRSQARKQMEEIERAALAAYQVDRTQFGAGTALGRPPPPPPPRRAKAEPPRRRRGDRDRPGGKDEEEEGGADALPTEREMLPEGEAPGQYSVQGTVYLEGHLYEDKLAVGRACEVFLEAACRDGDWCPGHIAARRVIAVPNTSLVMRRYRVALTGGGETPEVLADEIRIKAPPPPAAATEGEGEEKVGGEEEEKDAGVGGKVEDFFFGGGWNTVSVREVDEEAEEEERRREAAAVEASRSEGHLGATNIVDRQRQQQQQRADKDAGAVPAVLGEGEEEEDDAFRAFNPFGGAYKGVTVTDSAAMQRFDGTFRHQDEVAGDELPPPQARAGKVVAFKKKLKAGKGKRVRRKH